MNKRQRRRLWRILATQSQSRDQGRIVRLAHDMCRDMGMRVELRDGMLFAHKGDPDATRPFYIAHADTVHRIVPDERYQVGYFHKDGGRVYFAYDPTDGTQRGVGGDDKCGVFVAIEAARAQKNASVIITRDEEIGCQGARLVTADDLEQASVLIQADRRGKDDAVRAGMGDLSSGEWQWHVDDLIHQHGYGWTDHGVITDVFELHATGAASVSAINLSAAYWFPHSDHEQVTEDDLENCLELAIGLGVVSGERRWEHRGGNPWRQTYGGYDTYSDDSAWWDTYYGRYGRPNYDAGKGVYTARGVRVWGEDDDDLGDDEVEWIVLGDDETAALTRDDILQTFYAGGMDTETAIAALAYDELSSQPNDDWVDAFRRAGEEMGLMMCSDPECASEADHYSHFFKRWLCERHWDDALAVARQQDLFEAERLGEAG